MQLTQQEDTSKQVKKSKPGLRIPCKFRPNFLLSDIIAATIGPDVRTCDLDSSDVSLPSELNDFPELNEDREKTHSKVTRKLSAKGIAEKCLPTLDTPVKSMNNEEKDGETPDVFWNYSDNACDSFPKRQQVSPQENLAWSSHSNDGFGVVPEVLKCESNSSNSMFDTNSSNSVFDTNSSNSIFNTNSSISVFDTNYSNSFFDSKASHGLLIKNGSNSMFDINPNNHMYDTNSSNSMFDTNSSNPVFDTNSAHSLDQTGQATPGGQYDFSGLVSLNTNADPDTDFLSTAAGILERSGARFDQQNNVQSTTHDQSSISYDSDLEDSMNFVDPEDATLYEPDPSSPSRKKRRFSDIGTNDKLGTDFQDQSFPDLQTLINSEPSDLPSLLNRSQTKPLIRSSTLQANRRRHLSHHHGSSNLQTLKNAGKNFGRTRSFSGTCHNRNSSPPLKKSLNTSLTSLCENTALSNHPFFSELQSTLLSDCQSDECPKTLFETLTAKSQQDVYARERSLLAKFSSMQSKYPEEIQELSQFFRSQSADIEAERLREIHGDNVAASYKKHLNRYYDNQLHQIIDRVEKSLQLLSVAQRNVVSAIRGLKSRPILSRKAVSMMEEWYERNNDHPYPGPSAVEALAKAGEINPEQVKKWFSNKRNRAKNVKPMSEVMNLKRKRQFSAQW